MCSVLTSQNHIPSPHHPDHHHIKRDGLTPPTIEATTTTTTASMPTTTATPHKIVLVAKDNRLIVNDAADTNACIGINCRQIIDYYVLINKTFDCFVTTIEVEFFYSHNEKESHLVKGFLKPLHFKNDIIFIEEKTEICKKIER